jgi:stearoyl-CoA desaturase (delta-9 desaturase)
VSTLDELYYLERACQVQILSSVYIHNCTHGNFPRAINRIVGELCGVVVLTRYASWEIIHQRHHKYSDNLERDPHPIVPGSAGYWPFLIHTVMNVEHQLQTLFFELNNGDTPANRRFEKRRAYLSYATNLLLIYTWFVFLGSVGFFFLFVPAALVGFLHLVHFNWSTHNPYSPTEDYRPVNLNSGFYRVGNWLWHGIYMHGNHHKNSGMFNPVKMAADKALPIIRHGDSTEHYPRKKTKSDKSTGVAA